MTRTIFTLASARSGTVFLRGLFRRNVANCVSRHEPFFDWGNPTLFGRAIDDATAGRLERIRQLLAKKRNYVQRLGAGVYLESSHAFLKSAYVAALEFFPDLQLVHLVRNPLKVAKSEAYRETWRRRVHAPFHFYRGDDGNRCFVWALTGREPIFSHFDLDQLSLFQWYLIQWIEIENRAMRFLDDHRLHERCFTLHTPAELNDPETVRDMFEFFDLELLHPEISLRGRKNKSIAYRTVVTRENEAALDAVLEKLPDSYLEIFRREPYVEWPWSHRLTGRAVGVSH
jgi:hypothetical protein